MFSYRKAGMERAMKVQGLREATDRRVSMFKGRGSNWISAELSVNAIPYRRKRRTSSGGTLASRNCCAASQAEEQWSPR